MIRQRLSFILPLTSLFFHTITPSGRPALTLDVQAIQEESGKKRTIVELCPTAAASASTLHAGLRRSQSDIEAVVTCRLPPAESTLADLRALVPITPASSTSRNHSFASELGSPQHHHRQHSSSTTPPQLPSSRAHSYGASELGSPQSERGSAVHTPSALRNLSPLNSSSAVTTPHPQQVQQALEALRSATPCDNLSLFIAIAALDVEMVREALGSGVAHDSPHPVSGKTPLCHTVEVAALRAHNAENYQNACTIFKLLLDIGARPTSADQSKCPTTLADKCLQRIQYEMRYYRKRGEPLPSEMIHRLSAVNDVYKFLKSTPGTPKLSQFQRQQLATRRAMLKVQ